MENPIATPKQMNEEDHYYDRLANLQMNDSLAEKKNYKWITLSNGDIIKVVPWTENNEKRLNEMFPDEK